MVFCPLQGLRGDLKGGSRTCCGVRGRAAIHIIAEELDSTGQPYHLDHHDCLFTEDDDADADTYDDSDANAAAYGGDEL